MCKVLVAGYLDIAAEEIGLHKPDVFDSSNCLLLVGNGQKASGGLVGFHDFIHCFLLYLRFG
jgi:hypothetical protein